MTPESTSPQTQEPEPLIIGLTGNIATGKSAVMRLAAEQGALTIDADKLAHEVLATDSAVQEAIVAAFGAAVRREDGRIDRAALGQIVFADAQALQTLEAIVHPAVRALLAQRIAASSAPVIVIEAIKLLEGPLHLLCRQVWVTTCPRDLQLQRLQVCRGLDEATAVARVDAQSAPELKIAGADVVLDTSGLMRDTERQFAAAWAALPTTT